MLSIVILTKNEEHDLPGCLDSLRWCDDVHVVDSGSADATVPLAAARGARVLTNPFASFAQQRNWSLDHCPLRHDWILFLDADEHSTDAFKDALLAAIASAPADVAGYFCCWKLLLEGHWLKHADAFPRWQLRLLRKGRARFVDSGHGQKEGPVQGTLAYLREPYLHFAYSKGWTDWVAKHNRYSDLEARERATRQVTWRGLFHEHSTQRVLVLKALLTRFPFWPALRFFHAYILRLGFLDGPQGLIHCSNMMFFEYLVTLKFRQLRLDQRKPPPNPS